MTHVLHTARMETDVESVMSGDKKRVKSLYTKTWRVGCLPCLDCTTIAEVDEPVE